MIICLPGTNYQQMNVLREPKSHRSVRFKRYLVLIFTFNWYYTNQRISPISRLSSHPVTWTAHQGAPLSESSPVQAKYIRPFNIGPYLCDNDFKFKLMNLVGERKHTFVTWKYWSIFMNCVIFLEPPIVSQPPSEPMIDFLLPKNWSLAK